MGILVKAKDLAKKGVQKKELSLERKESRKIRKIINGIRKDDSVI